MSLSNIFFSKQNSFPFFKFEQVDSASDVTWPPAASVKGRDHETELNSSIRHLSWSNQVLLKFPIFRLKSSKKSSLEQLPHLTQDVNEEPDTWKSVMKPPPDRLVDREKRGRS